MQAKNFMTSIKGIVALALALGCVLVPAQAQSPRAHALDAAVAEIAAAEKALREAEENQKRALEPLPGERLGNVDGRSRLSPAYFERQKATAAKVEAARARLEAAYRRWDKLRD